MLDRLKLVAELRRDEGVRAKPYVDTVGKISIGIGRNLTDVGLRPVEIDFLLKADLDEALTDCESFSWWDLLNPTRQRAVCNMRFNVGPVRFRGFTRMLESLGRQDYQTAAQQMLASRWAGQVGFRAIRLAKMMQTGEELSA